MAAVGGRRCDAHGLEAFDSGCACHDPLGGNEHRRARWTDGYIERFRLLLLAPNPLGHLTRAAIVNVERLPEPVVARGKDLARRVLSG